MIIYLITNTVNGKKYVGQHCGTTDSRWKQHLAAALKLEDPKPLYSAFRKYGVDNFTYEVLETLPKDANEELLDEREIYFCIPGCTRTVYERRKFQGNDAQ
jgi:group I intron endonuclease